MQQKGETFSCTPQRNRVSARNNVKTPSNVNRMMGTAEGDKGAYNGCKGGYGYGNKGKNGNGENGNLQNKAQLQCRGQGALYTATIKLHTAAQVTVPISIRI